MEMSAHATERHVQEAIRLFKVSTIEALNSGEVVAEGMNNNPVTRKEVETCEKLLKRRLGISSLMSVRRLVDEIKHQATIPEASVRLAIDAMVKRDELQYRHQRMSVVRVR